MKRTIFKLMAATMIVSAVFTSCNNDEEGKDNGKEKKDCANKSHPDTTYIWENNKCIAKYTGTPVVQKKDTTILFNIPGFDGDPNNGGLPEFSELDTIAHLSHIADVYLSFAQEDQTGAKMSATNEIANKLKEYSTLNPKIKVVKGKIYVMFDPNLVPEFDLVNKFKLLGIEILQDPRGKP